MTSDVDAIAALVAAVEQRLFVAVMQRDQAAVLAARRDIARLKEHLPPAAERNAFAPPARSASLEASGDQTYTVTISTTDGAAASVIP